MLYPSRITRAPLGRIEHAPFMASDAESRVYPFVAPGRLAQGTLQATGSSVISTRRNSEPNPKAAPALGHLRAFRTRAPTQQRGPPRSFPKREGRPRLGRGSKLFAPGAPWPRSPQALPSPRASVRQMPCDAVPCPLVRDARRGAAYHGLHEFVAFRAVFLRVVPADISQ